MKNEITEFPSYDEFRTSSTNEDTVNEIAYRGIEFKGNLKKRTLTTKDILDCFMNSNFEKFVDPDRGDLEKFISGEKEDPAWVNEHIFDTINMIFGLK